MLKFNSSSQKQKDFTGKLAKTRGVWNTEANSGESLQSFLHIKTRRRLQKLRQEIQELKKEAAEWKPAEMQE